MEQLEIQGHTIGRLPGSSNCETNHETYQRLGDEFLNAEYTCYARHGYPSNRWDWEYFSVSDMYLEVTDDTLIATDKGVMRLSDLLHRPVDPSLWAICWNYASIQNGISFHRSHKDARDFILAMDNPECKPNGPARLVKVSQYLADKVRREGFCWTNLSTFDEATTYEEIKCSH